MYLAKVRGKIVSTQKNKKIEGYRLLIIHQVEVDTLEYTSKPLIAVDLVEANTGEIVLVCPGGSARHSDMTDGKPVDCTIVGIVDNIDISNRTTYKKLQA